MNQRKAGTVLSYIHILVTNTISILYTPYMLRTMGQSEYGLYGTASSFISYLSVLSFGIAGAYIRFNAKCRAENNREEEKRLNGMFLTIFSVLSLLVGLGGILLIACSGKMVENTFTTEELRKTQIIMAILVLNMMCSFVFNVVMMAIQAYERYFFLRIVLLLVGIFNPIVNVIVLHYGGRAIAISLTAFIFSIISYIIFYIYARRAIHMEFTFKGFRKDAMKEIFTFSAFLFLNSITDQITFSTDAIVLGSVKGTTAVAVYTVGAHFKGYFQQFSTTISSVFAPSVNLTVARGQDVSTLNELFIRVGRIQFYVVSLILIGYCSIGYDFICLWAGQDYKEAFWIGLLLMLAVFVPAFQNIGLEIQKAMNLHKARSVVYFLIALVNVAITIPLSRQLSGIGAALATCICMFIGTVLFMNVYYVVKIRLDIKGFWLSIGKILPGFIVPVFAGIVINRYWEIDSYVEVLLAAVIIMVIYIVSVWFISMNSYEKDLIKAPVKRLFKK